ncbi:oxidoreductase [Polychytrium aggregatum]|uniref:oxidoreductase n=1 Tax=Polychytrium aggregatum TaxID=110093 RepID=UPI0022FEBB2B|nr:oxidoreductase [Polychytrium aggregatum]KAI9201977.1 oxidoreductase [Polychytrium aggregatum]
MSTLSSTSTSDQVADFFGGPRCAGKTVLITGGNTGIGQDTVRVLASKGATVIFTSRSKSNGDAALAKLQEQCPGAQISYMSVDLSSLQSVKVFAEEFTQKYRELHILINNAGVMACPKSFTTDGFENQFGVNHIGHFYLTQLLLPLLKRTATAKEPARIINLSSVANIMAPAEGIQFDDLNADKSYYRWGRYGQSKFANVLFSKELQRRYATDNIVSVAVHPGVIKATDLWRYTDMWTNVTFMYYILTHRHMAPMPNEHLAEKTIPQGSATTVVAAMSPSLVPGGYYADCQETSAGLHKLANDEALAKKLWEYSEKAISERVAKF